MHMLAMTFLGSGYKDDGCTERIAYSEKLFKEAYGNPEKRNSLHHAFARIDPHDKDSYLLTLAANVRSHELMQEPLWPVVWRKVWDDLFKLQDEAQKQTALQARAARELAALQARAARELAAQKRRNRRLGHRRQQLPGADTSVHDAEHAERVRRYEEREKREREDAKLAEDLRRTRIASDRERRQGAAGVAANVPLPAAVAVRKKKTVVAPSAVEASKREVDNEVSLERLHAATLERRKQV